MMSQGYMAGSNVDRGWVENVTEHDIIVHVNDPSFKMIYDKKHLRRIQYRYRELGQLTERQISRPK